MTNPKLFTLDEALKAQRALRTQAGLGPEMFPMQAFVGMISDEIDSLRKSGKSDDEIAAVIRSNSLSRLPGARSPSTSLPPNSANGVASSTWFQILGMLLGNLNKVFQTCNQAPPPLARHSPKDTSYEGVELSRRPILKASAFRRAKDIDFSGVTCAWFPNDESSVRE
jgi:hypothetical protein